MAPRENPGVIAIASSNKKLSRSQREMVQQEPFSSALGEAELPSGVIVAVAVVRAFVRTETVLLDTHVQAERENAFGDFSPGRWAWLLGEVITLSRPIHVKGPAASTSSPVTSPIRTAGRGRSCAPSVAAASTGACCKPRMAEIRPA